jgi:hypothetical protein
MRNVLYMLWMNPALCLSKADLIWCFESFDSAIGYWASPAKRKTALGYIDWLVANVVPVEKVVLPPDEATVNVEVEYLDGEPGSGKTRNALRMIASSGPATYWWAINKIEPLAREREAELKEAAAAFGAIVDFLAIHSEASGQGTMRMRIDARAKAIAEDPLRGEKIYVTIITHKTLLDHFLSNVEGVLLIDEPVQCWEQRHFAFPTSYRQIRELLKPVVVGEDYDDALNHVVESDTQAIRLVLTEEGHKDAQNLDKKRDSIDGGPHRWIIDQSAMTSGRVFALAEAWNGLDESGGDIDVLALLHPRHVAHFDRTIMMAAHFEELMIFKLWRDLYDVTFTRLDLPDGWTRSVPLADRISVFYVLENRAITDTYLFNKGDPSRCRAFAKAVDAFLDEPFIWSVNERYLETGAYLALPRSIVGVDGEMHDAYLTPRANGINVYQNVHAAAWLGSIKLSGTTISLMKRIWGNDEATWLMLREFEYYAVLQFLARTNMRRFDSTDSVRLVVADKGQAEYLAEMWHLPPDRVAPMPMAADIKAALDDVASKGTGRKKVVNRTPEEQREYEVARKAKMRATTPKATRTDEQRAKNREQMAEKRRKTAK